MAKAGRWLAAEHPEITEPSQWTRQTCAAWVAAVDRMRVGDHVQRRDGLAAHVGTPISARTKAHVLTCSRTFFHDCQEWEWFPRRFDPARALAVPRSVAALIGTDPRVISDDVWLSCCGPGSTSNPTTCPPTPPTPTTAMPFIRAAALSWRVQRPGQRPASRLRVRCARCTTAQRSPPTPARAGHRGRLPD